MTGPFPHVEPESLPDPWCFVKRSRPPLGFCRTFSVRLPVKRYIQHEKYLKVETDLCPVPCAFRLIFMKPKPIRTK